MDRVPKAGFPQNNIVMAHRSVGHPVGLAINLKPKRRLHLGGPQSRAMTA